VHRKDRFQAEANPRKRLMPDPHVLIIATSLNPESRSLILAEEAKSKFDEIGISCELVSLREIDLPFCDGTKNLRAHPGVQTLREKGDRATHFLFAVPIYNGDVNSAARNVVNLNMGFANKTIGFLCASGGDRSYMSVFSLGNSLMFEYECWIVPRFVYAVKRDFEGGRLANPDIVRRIDRLILQLLSRPPQLLPQS
jgi:FMN reductase